MNELAKLAADDVVRILDLASHPEGGFYRETYRDKARGADGRTASTSVYFLLPLGMVSAWHRIDAAEIWHFYAGAPLQLSLFAAGGPINTHFLGPNLVAGERPQCVVPAGVWQRAEAAISERREANSPLPPWSLVGCTVAPGFSFSGFELAPPGWQPAQS
ncbi:MAG: cupin domain-containing protein [Beijerinckiaceae bacterium]